MLSCGILLAAGRRSTTFSFQLSSRTTALPSNYYPRLCVASSSARFSSSVKEESNTDAVKGTDLRIVKYPHPSLRAENELISREELKDKDKPIAKLVKEMFKIMYAAEGVGLAAPQVGVNKRLIVYNKSGQKKKWLDEVVLINPEIVEYSGATNIATEGCLSFPDMDGEVERSKWINVEAMTLNGKEVRRKVTGWEARIVQHECDHLDGTVYVDRLTEEDRAKVQPRMNELIKEFGDGGAI